MKNLLKWLLMMCDLAITSYCLYMMYVHRDDESTDILWAYKIFAVICFILLLKSVKRVVEPEVKEKENNK